MEDTPELPRHSGPLDLLRGASFPLRAAQLVLRVPRLRRLAALCAATTLLIFVAWGWLLWTWLPPLLDRMWHHPDGAAGWLWQLTLVVAGALAWLLGAATLPLLALAPLEDTLVAATEAAVGAPPAPPAGIAGATRQAVSAVVRTAFRVMLLLVGQALLLALQLLLPAAAPLWAAAGVGWTALFACAEYLDPPLARRGGAFVEVRRVLARRTALALGFGLSITVLLWVPLLNLFLLPVAVVAGTLLHRSLVSAGTLS
ncbi:MAG TPA: EI24 domain-containing protein [Myxococcaceae bacterium]|nr:EI24 domain-containing protein [Myxococcaceae bacterium]